MLPFARRSLLVQMLSVYLIFVSMVLLGGLIVDGVIEQRLRNDVQASDQALVQEIALRTSLQLGGAEKALTELGKLSANLKSPEEISNVFQVFQASRSDVDQVFWLDPVGVLQVSWPPGKARIGAEFSPPGVVQQALTSTGPVFEVGIVTETSSREAGVIMAEPVRNSSGTLTGIVAASFSLVDLSRPLETVVQAQLQMGRHLNISIIDQNGELVATPERQKILQTVLNDLPGADQALEGVSASRLGTGTDRQDWLFSAVPVPGVRWAAIVQRPASEALAVVSEFRLWLLGVALLFALGGLLFWLWLLGRVIRPLHTLALQHQTLPLSEESIPSETTGLPVRKDEVGHLARSLISLEKDGLKKLGELRTLLETSEAVVRSLEPHTVVRKIINEVQRLVDVQAAAVLLSDDRDVLRVLASEGHSDHYNRFLSLSPENQTSAPVLALRDGKPVQKLLETDSFSYADGFRAVLAIPIIGRHAEAVVLLVHRIEPRLFDRNEIELLLTFANYATLAWEHAVLYERSDEQLREVARENERLYREASQEKQKLEAIMGSMSEGLVLTTTGGEVLYSNQGVSRITGLSHADLQQRSIEILYTFLSKAARSPGDSERIMTLARAKEATELIVEIGQAQQHRAIHLRLFEVGDDSGKIIGWGLLLRDVTRQRDLEEFKSTLLAAVGHELRTPLAVIKGHASTLLQEDVTWSVADQRHSLQKISGEADRLARLVSNLLDLARQEAGLLMLNRESIKVSELISKTLEGIIPSGVSIILDVPDNLPPVYVDSGRIEVVLHNLIANALVYGEGQLRISAQRRDQVIVVSVWNNGPGIAPDEVPHVFERFYRARRGLQQRAGGTGIGLAICKAFIEAHEGQIWVAGEVDGGTTISFSLPLATSETISTAGEEQISPLLALKRRDK